MKTDAVEDFGGEGVVESLLCICFYIRDVEPTVSFFFYHRESKNQLPQGKMVEQCLPCLLTHRATEVRCGGSLLVELQCD